MSTRYYRLQPYITHLETKDTGGHSHISIWIDHGLAGTLTIPKCLVRRFLISLSEYYGEEGEPCFISHWSGEERGAIVVSYDETLPDDTIVISEYGEVLTAAQVRARDGAKRSDGYPTELFGYEE